MVARHVPKRRIMRKLRIDELSSVDKPAQAHARMTLMKRADDEDVEKKYKSPSELPESVRSSLPAAAQRQFMAVVNSALASGVSEERAFKQAWGAIKNSGWHKDKEGNWVKKDYGDGYASPSIVSQEVQAVDFDTVLAEHEAHEAAREVGEDLHEKWCALQRAFATIAADESVTAADKITAMQESLRQYIDSLAEQSTEIAESMTKSLTAVPALAALLKEEGDDEMNAAVKKQLDELQKTVTEIAGKLGKATDDEKAALTKQLEGVQAKLTELVSKAAEDDAERAELVAKAGMSDDEKSYMDKMSDEDKKGFMMMTAEERKKKMKKAVDDDPVVYKAGDGTEFRKSDGDKVVALAKRADESEKRAAAETEKRETAEFAKRADEELKPFSETVAKRDDKIAALRAIEKMEAGPKAATLKMLEVGGKAISAAFQTIGGRGEDVAKSVQAFEKHVSDIMARDKISKSAAMSKARAEHPDSFAAYQEAGGGASGAN